MTEDLTANERLVLNQLGTLSEFGCMNFKHLAERTGLSRDAVAEACRSLRKRGIADCHTGLVDDDGVFYGSGYGLSAAEVSRRNGEAA